MAMKLLNRLSTKIVIAGIIASLVFYGVVTAVSLVYIERHITQIYLEKAQTIAHLLDANITAKKDLQNNTLMFGYIQKNIWLDPDILSISIYLENQGVLTAVVSNLPQTIGQQASADNLNALKLNKIITRKIKLADENILRSFTPIHVARSLVGTFQFDLTLENLDKLKSEILQSMLFAYVVSFVIIIFFLVLYIRSRVVTPVINLATSVNRIAEGDFNARVSIQQRDELGKLGKNFNKMAVSLDKQREDLILARQNIEYQATHDELTGLPNRYSFNERLNQSIAFCKRHHRQGVLMMMDLDQFKSVNDRLGHFAGDQLLIQVSQRIASAIREEDMLARLGGDEFVVLIAEVSNVLEESLNQVQSIVDTLLSIIAKPFTVETHQLYISSSIGVVFFPGENHSFEEVVKNADTAMYHAKEDGGNCSRLFDHIMQEKLTNKIQVLNNLRVAIQQDQLQLYLQPQINNKGGVMSAEALVRWLHPEKDLLLPGEFVGLAEGCGLILELDSWVLQKVCKQYSSWKKIYPANNLVNISINVSPINFNQEKFCDRVIAILQQYDYPAECLTIEITETVLLKNFSSAIKKINRLKSIGVKFSLDDFGTGFSSLSYLKQLPLDELKIDQSFIHDMFNSAKSTDLIIAIINIAKTLDLSVVAEGVESQEQFDFLVKNDCQLFQGYLIDEPLSIDKFEKYFHNKH